MAERGAGPDVAVAGLRRGRPNAEGDDAPFIRGVAPGNAGRAEQLEIENDVIGGERENDRRRIARARDRRCYCDRRRGIAPQRLEHHRRLKP